MRAPGRAPITYADFGRAIREIAGGLASLGVNTGDKVAILCGTIPEWTMADFGAFCSGATVVPVYNTNSPEECEYVLSHSGAKVLLLEDAAQAAKIAKVRDALPELEHVIVLTGEAEGAITLADLRQRGAGSDIASERVAAVNPDDPATIVYTSGTTGPPKGCVLSHANLLYTAGAYIDRLGMRDAAADHLPVPAAGPRAGADGLLRRARHRRDAGLLERDHGEARRGHRRGQADPHPDRPAPAGEDPHARGQHRRRRRRREGADLHARARDRREGRQGQARRAQGQPDRPRPPRRRRQARAVEGPRRARPQQPGPGHRRGADRHRGDRVLLRLRRAGARGLRDDRDVRGRDAEHRR